MLLTNTYDTWEIFIRQTDGAEGGAVFSYNLAGTVRSSAVRETPPRNFCMMPEEISPEWWTETRTGQSMRWTHGAGLRKSARQTAGTEQYAYDHAGNILRSVDGEGNETTYSYDCAGNLTAVTDALGYTEQYAYDKEGRLAEKTDKNGVTTSYAFNLYGAPLYRREKGSLQGRLL